MISHLDYSSEYANILLLYLQFELSCVKSILKTTQGPSVDNYLFSNEDGFSCDCSDIKEVQRFLQDYAFIIRDAADIFCKEDNGNFILLKSIGFHFLEKKAWQDSRCKSYINWFI